jgi:hypothetical protein
MKNNMVVPKWIYDHINNSIVAIYFSQYKILHNNAESTGHFNNIIIEYEDGETSKIPAPPGLAYTYSKVGDKLYLDFTWNLEYFEEYLKESTYSLFFGSINGKTHIFLNWKNVCKVRYIDGVFIYEGIEEVLINSDMERRLKTLLHVKV